MLGAVTPLYIDDALLLLDKPAGLLAVPGRTEPDCLAARAQARWPDAQVVHRLDMATSGLMLFARGVAVQRKLSMAFAARRIAKRYEAVVHGQVDGDSGQIELPLGADWPRRPRQKVDAERGKPALTRWRVLARGKTTTRLELEPVTGRTHQLRLHLQAIGHAIVGDALYGADGTASDAAHPNSPRLLLHASRLALAHPVDGRALRFHSPASF